MSLVKLGCRCLSVLDCVMLMYISSNPLQGCASAPIWDGLEGTVVGVVSASDFIHTLQRLRCAVSRSGNNPLSEAEMDAHTVRGWACCKAGMAAAAQSTSAWTCDGRQLLALFCMLPLAPCPPLLMSIQNAIAPASWPVSPDPRHA